MANFETPLYYVNDNENVTNNIRSAIMTNEQNAQIRNAENISKLENATLDDIANQYQTNLSSELGVYLENSDMMAFQNEIYNTNMYMHESMNLQSEHISELSDKARNHILKFRQKYQLKLYDVSYYNFIKNLITFAIFVVALSMLLLGMTYKQEPPMLKPTITWIIIGVMVVLYLIITFLYIRSNTIRKKTDWTKYYFATYGVDSKTSCAI